MKSPLISFVSPVYRCKDCIEKLVEEIELACARLGARCEIILVDDRCPENSWERIEAICRLNPRVKGLRLSRNFGQHSAIEAGLRVVGGDWVVVLDCDLQDPPAALSQLWTEAQNGAEVVLVRRKARTDAWHRRFLSRSFYGILSSLTGQRLTEEVANFGLYQRKVIDAYNSWSEEQKFFPVIIQWLGYRQAFVDVPHAERFAGKSSYNFRRLLQLGLQVILSFSDRPLWFMSMFGVGIAVFAFLCSLVFVLLAAFGITAVQGWTSLILSIWFFGGANIAAAGFIGVYLGRTLREAKGRPSFVVATALNVDESPDGG